MGIWSEIRQPRHECHGDGFIHFPGNIPRLFLSILYGPFIPPSGRNYYSPFPEHVPEIIFLGLRVVLQYVEVIGLRVFPVDPGRPPAHLLGIRFNASTLYASNCALITVCRTRHDFRLFPKAQF